MLKKTVPKVCHGMGFDSRSVFTQSITSNGNNNAYYFLCSGMPTWTGSNGVVARPSTKPRFGKSKSSSSQSSSILRGILNKGSSSSSCGEGGDSVVTSRRLEMTSSELLDKIRGRNRLGGNKGGSGAGHYSGSENLFGTPTSGPEHHVDLLTDIRNFIAFQADGDDGEATTDDLVKRFKDKLPPKETPLFKALLQEIASFVRDLQGRGVWRLKAEFR